MVFDPTSGRVLPDNAVQRVLLVANDVHVYQIPPLTSTKGFSASSWTSPNQPTARQIFTARLRLIETSVDTRIKADILLEDADSGDLFAAAPYTSTAVVQSALDSSRFFAIRVQGDGGMKATLGIGFEDRSPAFDFGIALAEVRKILGIDEAGASTQARGSTAKSKSEQESKLDFSLKEGEKIHIQVGSRERRQAGNETHGVKKEDDTAALFSIAPPPPPAAKPQTNESPFTKANQSANDFGFDDGEFGEFQ